LRTFLSSSYLLRRLLAGFEGGGDILRLRLVVLLDVIDDEMQSRSADVTQAGYPDEKPWNSREWLF
jgi:hypothetical protein